MRIEADESTSPSTSIRIMIDYIPMDCAQHNPNYYNRACASLLVVIVPRDFIVLITVVLVDAGKILKKKQFC